jgi:hypothetical protein
MNFRPRRISLQCLHIFLLFLKLRTPILNPHNGHELLLAARIQPPFP